MKRSQTNDRQAAEHLLPDGQAKTGQAALLAYDFYFLRAKTPSLPQQTKRFLPDPLNVE